MTLRPYLLLALVCCAALCTAAPASAAESAPLFAGYWSDFVDHWLGVVQQQNGAVMLALGIGVVCLFVITRGKWQK